MEIWIVIGYLRYLVQGFPTLALGNWGYRPKGGGNLG